MEKELQRRYLNKRQNLPSKWHLFQRIDEDDDDFGEMKMVKVLTGRRRVRDWFDFL